MVVTSDRSGFLALILIVVVTVNTPSARAEEPITIIGNQHQVLGVRVARSASLRLANLQRAPGMSQRSVFVPAGSLLLVTKTRARDAKRRWRNLALTDTGILVYVKTKPRGRDKPQYWTPDNLWKNRKDKIAVAQTNVPVTITGDLEVTITPSERFDFVYGPDDTLDVEITSDRIGQGYGKDKVVSLPDSHFSVVVAEDLDAEQFPLPFQPYNVTAELVELFVGLKNLKVDEELRARFRELVNTRFVSKKECWEVVTIPVDISGEAGIAVKALIADIYAKLKLSVAYKGETAYPRGLSFDIQRFRRGSDIVEIKRETLQKEDCGLESVQRIIAGVSSGATGEINTKTASEYYKLRVTDAGLPIYTCRDEYLQLFNDLTVHDNLPPGVAALILSQFAVFEDAREPGICKK